MKTSFEGRFKIKLILLFLVVLTNSCGIKKNSTVDNSGNQEENLISFLKDSNNLIPGLKYSDHEKYSLTLSTLDKLSKLKSKSSQIFLEELLYKNYYINSDISQSIFEIFNNNNLIFLSYEKLFEKYIEEEDLNSNLKNYVNKSLQISLRNLDPNIAVEFILSKVKLILNGSKKDSFFKKVNLYSKVCNEISIDKVNLTTFNLQKQEAILKLYELSLQAVNTEKEIIERMGNIDRYKKIVKARNYLEDHILYTVKGHFVGEVDKNIIEIVNSNGSAAAFVELKSKGRISFGYLIPTQVWKLPDRPYHPYNNSFVSYMTFYVEATEKEINQYNEYQQIVDNDNDPAKFSEIEYLERKMEEERDDINKLIIKILK